MAKANRKKVGTMNICSEKSKFDIHVSGVNCILLYIEKSTRVGGLEIKTSRGHVLIALALTGSCDKYMGPSEVFISRPITSVGFIFI